MRVMKSMMLLLALLALAACGGAAAPVSDVSMPVVVDDGGTSAETAVDAYPAGEAPAPAAPAADPYPAGAAAAAGHAHLRDRARRFQRLLSRR